MKAVVMAGGEGSRLRPLTLGRPKPMVPLVNKPVIAHILSLLKQHGITEVVVTVQYMADMIQRYFGDGHGMGMRLYYSVEDTPLGTAGSVKNAQAFLDEPFIVISGDALTDIDLEKVIAFHQQKRAKITITLFHVPDPLEYGVVITDANGRIQRFLEKPGWSEVISDTVNTGIYVIEPEVLDYFEADKVFDFSQNLFPLMMEKGDPLYGYVADGYWCDVGNLQEYLRASGDILEGRVRVGPLGTEVRPGVWVEEDVDISPAAELEGPIFLGSGVRIRAGAHIVGPVTIKDNTIVDARAHVERSVIWANSYIGEAADVRGCIVGSQCNVKSQAVIFEGAVIGDATTIGQQAVIHPNVKIWPGKEIEAGAIVRASIIWGAQGRKVLFGRYGVSGLVNVDLTPEFAAKLGAAYGATLPRGATVTINRDAHRSARMIKRAMISGLPSSGVNVLDLRTVPIPVARYYTRVTGAAGGIHIRVSPFDSRIVDIRIMDAEGRNLGKEEERKIERVFFREDFRRVHSDEIGTIQYAANVVELYAEGFKNSLNLEAIRQRKFHLVLDYANSPAALVLPELLNDLNCTVVGLNERMAESRASVTEEALEQSLSQLASICQVLNADFGIRLDAGGEMVYAVDDKGRIVHPITLSAALADLALAAHGPGGTLVLPVSAPTLFDEIVRRRGGAIIRTKQDLHSLTQEAATQKATLALDGRGSFVFPDFQSMADGMMTVARLMEWLEVGQTRLSQVIAGLPEWHLAGKDVPCSWEVKGTVMRRLHEQHKGQRTEAIDGLKIWLADRRWVIVLPDPDRPMIHVHAEAESDAVAEELAERYARIVESLKG
ncbi:MAG: NTP transferase domain-containing protein [Chloroflexi bacterium]|nr:NTP transferase domain-containing protein [Chloroflexota bacterium]